LTASKLQNFFLQSFVSVDLGAEDHPVDGQLDNIVTKQEEIIVKQEEEEEMDEVSVIVREVTDYAVVEDDGSAEGGIHCTFLASPNSSSSFETASSASLAGSGPFSAPSPAPPKIARLDDVLEDAAYDDNVQRERKRAAREKN
jgi:hypothetical protein